MTGLASLVVFTPDVEAVAAAGTPFLSRYQVMEWGCRVVGADPDGRAVELNQPGHGQE